MYSSDVPANPKQSKIRVKGIRKFYVKRRVRHEEVLNVLQSLKPTPSTFRTFVLSNRVLQTVEINKACLNAFDDKRYILHDGVTTLAYGHKNIHRGRRVSGVLGMCVNVNVVASSETLNIERTVAY